MKMLLVILTALSSFLTDLETKTLQADFTLTIAADASQPLNHTGSITLCGKQFRLAVFDMEAAYDGNTLYIYSSDTDELTLSHPTEQELLETNPFLYAQALSKVCNIAERQTSNDQRPTTIITLTPKDQSIGIQRFTLTLTADGLPSRLEVKEGRKTTSLTLRNAKYIPAAGQQFTLTPDPKTYVNDLR